MRLLLVLAVLCTAGAAHGFELRELSGRVVDIDQKDQRSARGRAAVVACFDEYQDYLVSLVRHGLRPPGTPERIYNDLMTSCLVRYGYHFRP